MATCEMPTTCRTSDPIVVNDDGTIQGEVFAPDGTMFLRSWQPSSQPTAKDEEESERVRRRIKAVPKQCWFNARKVVLKLDDYSQASYVEGWAANDKGIIIEHGWVVRDGKVIDPTLPTKPYRYFPGLEFRGRAGISEFLVTPMGRKCKRSPFFYAFGWGGGDSPSYSAAMREALEFLSASLVSREVA